ncbi:ATP-binding protein [Aquimarina sp. MMG016]|uniref:ATP-binding protein n=1 Tax=Aquimarina sp. MMG016 TaxID=2822690 RepID=UPI001B3A57B4|nr:ATP-binding protein [Aquimarina sp. MMG016]MBQ4819781.1 response regulator [Aquimarina sp. MMG016]
MINTKRAVTFKIIAGYFLATLLALISFWVIKQQVENYTQITKIETENDKKLSLVGEVITSLYEAESLTRNIIQTSDERKYKIYKSKIDSVLININEIGEISNDTLQTKKIDSIKILIDSKNKNLKELIQIYRQRKQKGIYAQAIDELKKADQSFGDKNYQKRFGKLKPEFKKRVINILNMTAEDNAKRLTNQTIDSVATTVKQVLEDLEEKDKRYKREISNKENKLLKNDQIISKQLRDLLAAIDFNERTEYYSRLEQSNDVLNRTANFILVIAGISLIIAIIFLYLITKDVSKSQKYRNDLEREKTYTESLLKTRESLINTVTHDLRSPLNTVIGYSDLLEKTGLSNRQKHYLGHLKKSSDYILHLVNDLLDLSKLEAGRMVIEELPFSPKKLIANTVSSIIPVNDKKKLDVRIITEDCLKQQYLSDPFRIKQILTNLVNNAYKFTDEGSITITSSIIENGLAEKQLVISVKDTGIGITEEQQQYIFEEFSQGDDETEKRYGGFGLGLAITKKIIKLLNGKVTLESNIDEGSNFTIYIPIKLSNSLVVEDTESESIEMQHFSNHKVLIIDDDLSQLGLTSEVVSLAGLSYDICENAIDALNLLKNNIYDLILTDIQMPKMDGFELLNSIKKQGKYTNLPIIALSGMANTTAEDYKNAGFSGSLRKPYAPKELIDLIAKVLKITPIEYQKININEEDSNEEYSLNDLMLFAQGDSDSLYAILDTFYESTIKNLEDLKIRIENEEIDQIKKIAHRMLPMFKQIKAKGVTPLLTQLEHPDQYKLNNTSIISIAKDCVQKIESLMGKLKVEN